MTLKTKTDAAKNTTLPKGAMTQQSAKLRIALWWQALRLFVKKIARSVARSFGRVFGSSLTRRIVVLNLGGLVALLLGFLYLNQFRDGLINAYLQSLQTQGEIIAAAIAASATVDTDELAIDPEKLLNLAPGQSLEALGNRGDDLEFSINPERVGFLLRRLVSPTHTRARVYDSDGNLLVDTHLLNLRNDILRTDLPETAAEREPSMMRWLWQIRQWFENFNRTSLPLYRDIGLDNGKSYPEVAIALQGALQAVARMNSRGTTIVLVAVPIQRYHAIRGVLLLSTQGDDIDTILASERQIILRVFGVSALIMLALSLFLAKAIAGPVRRLSEAAERVRRGIKARHEIPDFTSRCDEIGHLSGALRDMTRALYNRIEAIESFAADVAHELKNPLTSLRSAVEILPRIEAKDGKERLMGVITHDVQRLDRLISDISDASRLDAELARADTSILDLQALLTSIADLTNEVKRDSIVISFSTDVMHDERSKLKPAELFLVQGHASRLGQVVTNLLDNARSFSPEGGSVRLILRRLRAHDEVFGNKPVLDICVEDEGPGIPKHALERIFERFYTDRPAQKFGQNSGLGLSISRQIVEAHGGKIWAENIRATTHADGEKPAIIGARFTVRLPAVK